MLGTQHLPQELGLASIANRFLKQIYLPDHNRCFATPPEGFVPFASVLDDILHEERSNDNTGGRILQLPADRHRRHKARVRVHPDHTLAVGRLALGRRVSDRNPEGCVTRAILRRPKPLHAWPLPHNHHNGSGIRSVQNVLGIATVRGGRRP